MTYRFGREVTVKLPEPQRVSSSELGPGVHQVWPVGVHDISVKESKESLFVRALIGSGDHYAIHWLTPYEAKRVAAALLAAADYAERGEA